MGWYEDYPDNWDDIRKAVYKRDGYACQRCSRRGGPYGNVELHCHHITPKSEGGSHHPRNLQTLCWRCHNAEHDHHVQRMSDLSRKSSTSRSSRRESQSTGSPGFDPSSMDTETEQLRDIFIGVSGQEESTDTKQNSDTVSDPDDDGSDWEQRATEYECPNCGEMIKRTGWFGMYHHFVDCELPSERPPPLSEDQWKKVQNKIEQPPTSSQSTASEDSHSEEITVNDNLHNQEITEYPCPNCNVVLSRPDWIEMYHHFTECELPSERPQLLSEDQWKKVQNKIEQPPTSSQSTASEDSHSEEITVNDNLHNQEITEYPCPNCNVVLSRPDWIEMYHHFTECELPSERPQLLSEDQWKNVQSKVETASTSSSEASSTTSKLTKMGYITGETTSSSTTNSREVTRNRIGAVSLFYLLVWLGSVHLTGWLGPLFPMLLVGGTASHIGYVWYTQNPSRSSQMWMLIGLVFVIISALQFISLHNTATRLGISALEAYVVDGSLSTFMLVIGHFIMRKGMLSNYVL